MVCGLESGLGQGGLEGEAGADHPPDSGSERALLHWGMGAGEAGLLSKGPAKRVSPGSARVLFGRPV